jgi:hypothetical protein
LGFLFENIPSCNPAVAGFKIITKVRRSCSQSVHLLRRYLPG